MKRLMIVADHSLAVHAIRLALRQTAGFRVVGFFDGRTSIRQALVELDPDVVLVDDMQHSGNALARIREAAEATPDAKSLLLTLRMEGGGFDEALGRGGSTRRSSAAWTPSSPRPSIPSRSARSCGRSARATSRCATSAAARRPPSRTAR